MYPSDGRDFGELLKCADTAMHPAKDDGRNRYVFFTAEMQAISARKLLVENALRNALERRELQVYYQPQVSLANGQITGAEALLRWTRRRAPRGGSESHRDPGSSFATWFEPSDDLAGHTQALPLFDQTEVILDDRGDETHRHPAFARASRSSYAMHIVGG